MSKIQLARLVGALLAGLSLGALAGIEYTPWQEFSIPQSRTGSAGDATLTFDQYNPAVLGPDLTGIQFELNASSVAVYQFRDLSGSPNDFTVGVDFQVAVGNTAVGSLVVALPDIVDELRSVAAFGSYDSPGFGLPPDFDDPNVLTGNDSETRIYEGAELTPEIAALFTGTGTVQLDAGARSQNFTAATGDSGTDVLTRYEASGRIRYSYQVATAVSVPASLLLLGVGVIAVGALRRRDRNHA